MGKTRAGSGIRRKKVADALWHGCRAWFEGEDRGVGRIIKVIDIDALWVGKKRF